MNLQEAETALREALELDAQNGRARIELGTLYEDQGKFAQAAGEFERAIAIDPNHCGAHCQLGRIYRRQGRLREAEAALRKALALDPQDGWARFELGALCQSHVESGSLYEGQSKFDEAAVEFERVIAIDPDHGGAHRHLGQIYRRQGRSPEAEASLRKALELEPQDGCARIELGVLYETQGKFTQAAGEFERGIAIDPDHGGAHRQLGEIYRRQGRWPEAEAALRKAVELEPQNGTARFELGALYADQNRFIEAAAEFERAIAVDPHRVGAYDQLGRMYCRQGRFAEAEAALRKALELDPRDGGACAELGVLYGCQNRWMRAAAQFERAVGIDPNLGWGHFELGRIYRKQRRWSESEAAFEKVLAIEPRIARVFFEMGLLYKDQDRFPEADAAFQKAIACDPNDSAAHLELGNVYRRQGRWREAEAEFKKAAAVDPGNDRAYVGLWAIYRRQGRTAEAEAVSRKASALNVRNAWACAGANGRGAQGLSVPAATDAPLAPGPASEGSVDLARDPVSCLLPWTHLHVRMNGASFPCCVWCGPPLGNMRSSTLAELWNSPGMKALRSDMMGGRPLAGCQRCYEDERLGFCSMRQQKNINWNHHRGRKRLTAPDGTLPQSPALSLDIRFSNVCNLRCRTCEPMLSSAWMADARAPGLPVQGGSILKSYDDWDTLWRQLRPLLDEGVEEISFAGGEPLMSEEHYRILDFLIACGRTDVRLFYNTNFSILRFQGRDVIDLWSRFRDVHVAASLDGSGRRGEYLRKGLRWDSVVANREEMLRRCPDVAFSVSTTLSIFNALHLPDFYREWVEKGYINRDEFTLIMLVSPEIYCMQVLPPPLKEKALESYGRLQESFLDADASAARDFTAAARFMEEQDRSELLRGFLATTRRLDALRGEDCREVFPELAALFEAAA